MSVTTIPNYQRARTGEEISPRRLRRLNQIRQVLVARQTPAERAFMRTWSAFTIPKKKGNPHHHPLWMQPQKIFNVSAELTFFVDFYVAEFKLAIELDGRHHYTGRLRREWDEWRTKLLGEYGVTVLRYPNDDVLPAAFSAVRRTLRHIERMDMPGGCRRRLQEHLRKVWRVRPAFRKRLFETGE